MIFVRYRGRLGNNLFQWAAGWIVGVLTGQGVSAPAIGGFDGTHRTGTTDREPSADAPRWQRVCGDLGNIIKDARRRDVVIEGHPRDLTRLFEFREQLRDVLRPNHGAHFESTADDLVVHLRGTDYFAKGERATAFEYPFWAIGAAVKAAQYKRLLVVTDEPGHLYVRMLVRTHGAQVVSNGDVMHDWRTLYHAKRLILAPSTFGWWAAFLGRPDMVRVPALSRNWQTCERFLASAVLRLAEPNPNPNELAA